MKEKQKKLLQTINLDEETAEAKSKKSGGSLNTNQVEDGKAKLSDRDFVLRHAVSDDLKEMRKKIEARAKEVGWMKLPDGVMLPADCILYGCPNCRRWLWAKPGLETCPICKGKKVRIATKAEVKSWWTRERAAHKKFLEDIPKKKKEVADFNKRQFQDASNPRVIHDPTIRKG